MESTTGAIGDKKTDDVYEVKQEVTPCLKIPMEILEEEEELIVASDEAPAPKHRRGFFSALFGCFRIFPRRNRRALAVKDIKAPEAEHEVPVEKSKEHEPIVVHAMVFNSEVSPYEGNENLKKSDANILDLPEKVLKMCLSGTMAVKTAQVCTSWKKIIYDNIQIMNANDTVQLHIMQESYEHYVKPPFPTDKQARRFDGTLYIAVRHVGKYAIYCDAEDFFKRVVLLRAVSIYLENISEWAVKKLFSTCPNWYLERIKEMTIYEPHHQRLYKHVFDRKPNITTLYLSAPIRTSRSYLRQYQREKIQAVKFFKHMSSGIYKLNLINFDFEDDTTLELLIRISKNTNTGMGFLKLGMSKFTVEMIIIFLMKCRFAERMTFRIHTAIGFEGRLYDWLAKNVEIEDAGDDYIHNTESRRRFDYSLVVDSRRGPRAFNYRGTNFVVTIEQFE